MAIVDVLAQIPPELGTMGAEEHEWLAEHPEVLISYPGKWVAVVGREIVAVADSAKEVSALAAARVPERLPLVFQVPHEDEGPYLL
jgi:hypothetical protein